MIRLYAFLGNHGREYRSNRHNVAWQFLETLSFFDELKWERKFKGRYAHYETANGRIWFLVPETYMNLSGESAAELVRFYQIVPTELLAVHDEIEMPFGYFGFKLGGGLGGHNGLRSLETRLGTRDFARLRFGVGRPDHPDVASYVLSDFSKSEREILDSCVFPKARAALDACLSQGFETALVEYQKVRCIE